MSIHRCASLQHHSCGGHHQLHDVMAPTLHLGPAVCGDAFAWWQVDVHSVSLVAHIGLLSSCCKSCSACAPGFQGKNPSNKSRFVLLAVLTGTHLQLRLIIGCVVLCRDVVCRT